MESKMNARFCIRKSRVTKSNLSLVFLRVTIVKVRFETSINRFVTESKWSDETGKAKGNSAESKSLNEYLETLLGKYMRFKEN